MYLGWWDALCSRSHQGWSSRWQTAVASVVPVTVGVVLLFAVLVLVAVAVACASSLPLALHGTACAKGVFFWGGKEEEVREGGSE